MLFQSFSREYVELLSGGDQETERHFAAYFNELLLIKLRRRLGTQQAIDDVRQETFLRVIRVLKSKGLECPEKLGAFVNGVCNNVLSEHHRSAQRLSPLPERSVEPASMGPDPEAELVTEERKQQVREVLATLPPKDRDILRMVFLEEQEKDDVCRACKVDRGYLRVLVHRAKNRFRKQLPQPAMEARGAA